jgi:two-component system CheB/CheR fusion protein
MALRVMVVDDELDTVAMLSAILRDEGHEVLGLHRGYDVLPAVAAFDPDAVLLDLALADMDGHQVCRAIRERHGDARPALIAISGRYTRGADSVLARMNGFNHHMVKPCDPRKVIELLGSLAQPRGAR